MSSSCHSLAASTIPRVVPFKIQAYIFGNQDWFRWRARWCYRASGNALTCFSIVLVGRVQVFLHVFFSRFTERKTTPRFTRPFQAPTVHLHASVLPRLLKSFNALVLSFV